MQQIRHWLQQATVGTMQAADLFPLLAQHLTEASLLVAMAQGQVAPVPLMDGEGRVHCFTDSEAIRAAGVTGQILRTQPLSILQAVIRHNASGMVLNPGSEAYRLDGDHLRLLFREFALVELKQMGGAWTPVREGSPLALELPDKSLVLPVYLTHQDAEPLAARQGGKAEQVEFGRLAQRAREVGAEALFLQFGHPEQVGLNQAHIAWLTGRKEPLQRLEEAISRSGGVANADEICQALAELAQIWVLQDLDGDILGLEQQFDLFTAMERAEVFIAGLGNGLRERVRPALVPAQGFFRFLAENPPAIRINRGSTDWWFGFGDTIPNVLQRALNL